MADKITMANGVLTVPTPIIPYVEGVPGSTLAGQQLVMDAAAKHGKSIAWKEVLAGQKASMRRIRLPDETVRTRFATTSSGSRAPSRRSAAASVPERGRCASLDLYVCLRPCGGPRAFPRP